LKLLDLLREKKDGGIMVREVQVCIYCEKVIDNIENTA
jgi:hypothetical protein